MVRGSLTVSALKIAELARRARNIVQEIGDQLGISPQFEIARQPRGFDLVADISKLIGMYHPKFTPFAEGMRRTLEV